MSTPEEKRKKIERVYAKFRQLRFLAIMITCLVGGMIFGIVRLIPLVRGGTADWAGLTIAWLFFLMGLVMLTFRVRRKKP